jgi:vitellogenic carboxypeptidase-like protein
MFGLFGEVGAMDVNKDLTTTPKAFNWNKKFHLLFFDQPAGVGWSKIGKGGEVKTEREVGAQMLEALRQFFTVWNEYVHNEFYIVGESYGGKYGPAVGYAIHTDTVRVFLISFVFFLLVVDLEWISSLLLTE